jgi:NAD(P)-dependent dehydrogenase (short-subunit alcohol dehydrogenase family)
MTIELAGRTAFITGGAQGIGLGIARALAGHGVQLALADIDAAALAQAADELGATKVATAVLDVRDRDAFTAAADEIEAALGPVTIVCNNAGVAGNTKVHNLSYEAWDWVMGINLAGVYNGIQTFIPRLLQRGDGGHLVNTASGAGLLSSHSGFLYAASKAGVIGLSEALRTELAPHGIGVTCLCPSAVNTNIIGHTTGSAPEMGERTAVMDGMDEHLGFFAKLLAHGTDPDDVGRMVVRGILDDATYVLTDTLLKDHLQLRVDELISSMPAPA